MAFPGLPHTHDGSVWPLGGLLSHTRTVRPVTVDASRASPFTRISLVLILASLLVRHLPPSTFLNPSRSSFSFLPSERLCFYWIHIRNCVICPVHPPSSCVQARLISGLADLACSCVFSMTDSITIHSLARRVPDPEPHMYVAPFKMFPICLSLPIHPAATVPALTSSGRSWSLPSKHSLHGCVRYFVHTRETTFLVSFL